MILDQYRDRSFRVFAAKVRSFGAEARELVKEATIDYDEAEALPETAFAWPEERRLAVHTSAHAALSCIYAHGEKLPPHVTANLEKAAELYELDLKPMEKTAEEVPEEISDYLIPHRRFGRIDTKEHVKEASDFFTRNYKKLDLMTRANAASTLVKKAREFEVKLAPSIYKHAGLTQTNSRVLSEWLEVRSNLSKTASVKEGFTKLAAHVASPKAFSFASRDDLLKIAETIATLDEKEGLQAKYDRTLPDPLSTVFNTTKLAESKITLATQDVSVSKLMKVAAKRYGEILGEDIVPEITDKQGNVKEAELLDVLKSLPADLQVILLRDLKF
jgi:hypothetical protein